MAIFNKDSNNDKVVKEFIALNKQLAFTIEEINKHLKLNNSIEVFKLNSIVEICTQKITKLKKEFKSPNMIINSKYKAQLLTQQKKLKKLFEQNNHLMNVQMNTYQMVSEYLGAQMKKNILQESGYNNKGNYHENKIEQLMPAVAMAENI